MKIRPQTYLLGIILLATLSACAKSCYTRDDTVLSQKIIGDAENPEGSGVKFPFESKLVSLACQTPTPVRVEMNINPYGYVQTVAFLDPWQNDCASEYVSAVKSSRLVDVPLSRSLEHFRVDINVSRVSSRQCINLQ